MTWERPTSVPYPNVWWTFEAPDPDRDDGGLATYRVEDLTEDRFEDAIKLYTENFLDDEPLCQYGKIRHNPVAYEEIVGFWNYCLNERITIVCYKEGSKELVGANLLSVKQVNNKVDFSKYIRSEGMQKLVAVNEYMTDTVNLFERYGVDKYLTAYGLSVNSRYRGRGIATEILKARVPICKAFGLRLTSTNFTAIGSQVPAAKVGFKTDLEIRYDEFVKVDPSYTFDGIKGTSIKLMSLVIE
ncbi:AGAP004529-PA-like protein [Anopheles sinensis]|uniref:AGAP004529-PA-like protein n=1 Tax=Anopheles sinensis TaxID=74873 RepID=A0A084WTX4_ANOSI|nr:AGAP004529-PA-like protein [Anopheles sinensis]